MTETKFVGLLLPLALVSEIDRARGDVPRSRFIRRLLEQSLAGTGTAGHGEGSGRT